VGVFVFAKTKKLQKCKEFAKGAKSTKILAASKKMHGKDLVKMPKKSTVRGGRILAKFYQNSQ
jgi:hypothetical protein